MDEFLGYSFSAQWADFVQRFLLFFALALGFASPCFATEFLTDVKWSRLPTLDEFNAHYPSRTEDDFVGEVHLECRIRTRQGDLKCKSPEIDPWYVHIGKFVQALAEGYYKVDMAKTDRAAVGRHVRITIRFAD
ncbi:hypothetical protein [Asticcacaulis sp. AC402]|uniref:hypothetical protein n=1 Tax=Asticcacaulis sp. AC402 TaxID=1282361 RepID=UPI0003C3E37A|nr:hypothetical protein [Asticcacaulis sp. AC402]ESQ75430.1 hypothetical protein ABAC402_10040 [Asticcacaulis sp. AC402]